MPFQKGHADLRKSSKKKATVVEMPSKKFITDALLNSLVSKKHGKTPVNVVDGLFAVAEAINNLAAVERNHYELTDPYPEETSTDIELDNAAGEDDPEDLDDDPSVKV